MLYFKERKQISVYNAFFYKNMKEIYFVIIYCCSMPCFHNFFLVSFNLILFLSLPQELLLVGQVVYSLKGQTQCHQLSIISMQTIHKVNILFYIILAVLSYFNGCFNCLDLHSTRFPNTVIFHVNHLTSFTINTE